MYRTFDFLLSPVGILVLLLYLSIVFLLTWIDVGSPIFIQTRMGRNEVPFPLYKFRTMRMHASENRLTGTISPTHITRLGRFLRHYKIDELPQL
jgi:O-antigen biosynthesis protein WbqP